MTFESMIAHARFVFTEAGLCSWKAFQDWLMFQKDCGSEVQSQRRRINAFGSIYDKLIVVIYEACRFENDVMVQIA